MSFVADLKFALRSFIRAKGLALTVIVTLALGIGANAAIFSVVRSVLLRPLVNRDADRLIYIRQTALGIGTENLTFSMPEINDFKSRVTTIAAFGDFSTVDFTLIGFGQEPRVVKAGVVNGSFFEVMGLRPVLGRLLNAADDGPGAAGAVVLTHRFWTTVLHSDPAVIGKTIRLGPRHCDGRRRPRTIRALSGGDPDHRERRDEPAPSRGDDGDRPHAPHDRAVRPAGARRHTGGGTRRAHQRARVDDARASRSVLRAGSGSTAGHDVPAINSRRPHGRSSSLLLAAAAVVFVIACSNVANLILARSVRREAELAVRAALGAGRGALRRTLLAESLVLCAAGAMLGLMLARAARDRRGRAMPRAFPFARSKPRWTPACSGSGRGWPWWRRCCSPTFHGSRHPIGRPVWGWLAAACG